MPEARHQMIVDHADGLHMRVDDRAADEFEAALLEVFAQGVGFFGSGRQIFHARKTILDRQAADETPNVFVECAEFFPHVEKVLSIRDRRRDLQAIAEVKSMRPAQAM